MPVNIVYPIDGATHPITDPACRVESAYFAASFSATCGGGPHNIGWGFDDAPRGDATFYEQFSAQFVSKLAAGKHRFWISSDCGDAEVAFAIGS